MPQIGDIASGHEIGKAYNKYVWLKCGYCGKERWVKLDKRRKNQWCRACFFKVNNPNRDQYGAKNHNWKGGRTRHSQGYIQIHLPKDDFFVSMMNHGGGKNYGYVLEHRLVMARYLGRCLHSWEIVHHKHTKYPAGSVEDKQDNRIENLQLVSDDRHIQITILESKIKKLQGKIATLKPTKVKRVSDEVRRKRFPNENKNDS